MNASLSIEYRTTPDGHVPSKWVISQYQFKTGNLMLSDSVTIDVWQPNCPVSDDDFRVQMPAGTWVRDLGEGKRYILKADGSRREILKGEYDGKNYQRLLETEPGELSRDLAVLANANQKKPAASGAWWLVVVNAGVLGLLIIVVVARRIGFRHNASGSR